MAGKYFEEFSVGQVFKHQPGRTITETDNVLFTTLTMNPQPLHLDEEFAKQTEFGQRLVNSLLTLGIAVGLSVADTTLGTTIANLGFDKIDFPKPVFHGDTIYVETEIVDKRESRSRPDAGVVFFEHRAINQRQELVEGRHERVVVDRLIAPLDVMLVEPVVERAPHSREEAIEVG